MTHEVFKVVELTGSSSVSIEDAVQTAITRASNSVRHLRWFQVLESRGSIKDDRVSQSQVVLKVGFALE